MSLHLVHWCLEAISEECFFLEKGLCFGSQRQISKLSWIHYSRVLTGFIALCLSFLSHIVMLALQSFSEVKGSDGSF